MYLTESQVETIKENIQDNISEIEQYFPTHVQEIFDHIIQKTKLADDLKRKLKDPLLNPNKTVTPAIDALKELCHCTAEVEFLSPYQFEGYAFDVIYSDTATKFDTKLEEWKKQKKKDGLLYIFNPANKNWEAHLCDNGEKFIQEIVSDKSSSKILKNACSPDELPAKEKISLRRMLLKNNPFKNHTDMFQQHYKKAMNCYEEIQNMVSSTFKLKIMEQTKLTTLESEVANLRRINEELKKDNAELKKEKELESKRNNEKELIQNKIERLKNEKSLMVTHKEELAKVEKELWSLQEAHITTQAQFMKLKHFYGLQNIYYKQVTKENLRLKNMVEDVYQDEILVDELMQEETFTPVDDASYFNLKTSEAILEDMVLSAIQKYQPPLELISNEAGTEKRKAMYEKIKECYSRLSIPDFNSKIAAKNKVVAIETINRTLSLLDRTPLVPEVLIILACALGDYKNLISLLSPTNLNLPAIEYIPLINRALLVSLSRLIHYKDTDLAKFMMLEQKILLDNLPFLKELFQREALFTDSELLDLILQKTDEEVKAKLDLTAYVKNAKSGQIIRTFIYHGAQLNPNNLPEFLNPSKNFFKSSFHFAIMAGDLELFKLIFNRNKEKPDFEELLYVAIIKKRAEIINFILKEAKGYLSFNKYNFLENILNKFADEFTSFAFEIFLNNSSFSLSEEEFMKLYNLTWSKNSDPCILALHKYSYLKDNSQLANTVIQFIKTAFLPKVINFAKSLKEAIKTSLATYALLHPTINECETLIKALIENSASTNIGKYLNLVINCKNSIDLVNAELKTRESTNPISIATPLSAFQDKECVPPELLVGELDLSNDVAIRDTLEFALRRNRDDVIAFIAEKVDPKILKRAINITLIFVCICCENISALQNFLALHPEIASQKSPSNLNAMDVAILNHAKAIEKYLNIICMKPNVVQEACSNDTFCGSRLSSISSDQLSLCRSILNHECEAVAQILKSNGTKIVNLPLPDSNITPLMLAALKGNSKMVELLLNHGASVFKESNFNMTAIDFAMLANHSNIIEILSSKGCIAKYDSSLQEPITISDDDTTYIEDSDVVVIHFNKAPKPAKKSDEKSPPLKNLFFSKENEINKQTTNPTKRKPETENIEETENGDADNKPKVVRLD